MYKTNILWVRLTFASDSRMRPTFREAGGCDTHVSVFTGDDVVDTPLVGDGADTQPSRCA